MIDFMAAVGDWQGWRIINAISALTAFGFYLSNTIGMWDQWSPSDRRVSASICALLVFMALGSIEAWQRGNDVLLSTIALSAVLVALASSLALDRQARH